jgi:hypothetical protein
MASSEAQRGHLRPISGFKLEARPPAAMRRLFSHPVALAVLGELAAVAALLAAVGAVLWPLLDGRAIYAESDTFTFFYPVFAVLRASIRAGELPLWSPDIFGGFPLFAEGQIGALYLPSLAAARLPSPIQGFLLLRVFHICVAVLGAFALARVLGIGLAGAMVGGLAFGLGSFVIAQQHHANLLAAAVWLPVVLAFVELGLARQGWLGHALLGVAALVLGLAALATHVQPLMLTGGLLTAYVLARQGWMATWLVRRRGFRGGLGPASLLLTDAVAMVAFIGAVGALIAAAQLVPLYELSQESWRAQGWSYQDAIEYSLPPINLVTLVFPFFFRSPDGGQWSLWQLWESVVYVGVVPLVLALVATLAVRRWAATFFAVAALVSLVIALGGYAPFGLYEGLWHIPGMSLQRAPARFTLITTLSLAMLAAYGADWLASSCRAPAAWSRHRRRLLALHVGVLVLIGAIAFHLVAWRSWLQADRPWAMQALASTYLALGHEPLQSLEPLDVARGLEASLDLANPKTALPLAVLALFGLVILAWRECARAARLWQGLLVLLVAGDLVVFASDLHPLVDVSYLGDPGTAGRTLIERTGPWRVLTRPDVDVPQPNELLPHGVAEASGYSPLQLERHRWYAQSVDTVGDVLLDLWSVRWIVQTTRVEPMPSYQQVSFHPRRPLLIGGVGTPNGELTLRPDPTPTTQVRLIAALNDGATIADGELVGEWLVTDADGVNYVLPIRAGREIADWQPRTAGVPVAHRPIQAAARIPVDDDTVRVLGYAELGLPRRVDAVSLQYRHLNPVGQTVLYGVALYDREQDAIDQVTREDRYSVAYSDAAVTIFENPAAYPRAFVVPEAVVVPEGTAAMVRLRDGPLDPRRQVVVEGLPDIGVGPFTGSPAVDATIVAEGTAVVDVHADAPAGGFLVLTDPYYPGWRALVDGDETTILRADYLFRAVALGPGSHDVRFIFEPPSLRRGATLSLAGLAIALVVILAGIVVPLVARRPWRRRSRAGSEGAS